MKHRHPMPVGQINGDLRDVAKRIFSASFDGTLAVWVDDAGEVLAERVEKLPEVPAAWLVGTFCAGTSVGDIVEDLRAALRERARDWIVD
jgi:hypothetical protein